MLLDDIKDFPSPVWGPHIRKDVAKELRNDARRARPYVFDKEASRKLGEFIKECPDIIADNLQFAIPPFPITYIELDMDICCEAMGNPPPPFGAENVDWKVGYLINEEGLLKIVVNSRDKPGVFCHGIAYQLREYLDPDYIKFWDAEDADSAVQQKLLWGSSFPKLTSEQMTPLCKTYLPDAIFDTSIVGPGTAEQALLNSAGELRVYIAALLLIQQKRCVSIGEKSWERKISRGKLRTFMAHSTVTILIDGPAEIRKSFSATDRQSPRAHEVPAHYCHRHGDRGCEHVWVARVDEENHWDCSKCGRFRYLRKHHMRGDASKGFVTRDYEVKTCERS